ncbi:MAG: hypothetical protein JWN13_132 [Betaproteobacteria bacterium]|nr:hypothetical protein [Betaproteobacteria bacterium]
MCIVTTRITMMKAGIVAACFAGANVGAQSYPSKPVRVIVPWSAGSGTDLMSRSLASKMTEALGQQVIVDNRGGAGAIIGSEVAAKSPPDGYTLYIGGVGIDGDQSGVVRKSGVRSGAGFLAGFARVAILQRAFRSSFGAREKREGAHRGWSLEIGASDGFGRQRFDQSSCRGAFQGDD